MDRQRQSPVATTATLLRAASFAADKHSTQRRKDAADSPYINHPLALADLLANDGGVTDIAILCAALLHPRHLNSPAAEKVARSREGCSPLLAVPRACVAGWAGRDRAIPGQLDGQTRETRASSRPPSRRSFRSRR